jgi:hypothetical protein
VSFNGSKTHRFWYADVGREAKKEIGALSASRILVSVLCFVAVLPTALYEVSVESSNRKTVTGQTIDYQLYCPKPATSAGVEQRFPIVALTHGSPRNSSYHKNNARFMAERGIVVMTPNMMSLLGTGNQKRNIANTVDYVVWLIRRSFTPGDGRDDLEARRVQCETACRGAVPC